MIVRSHALHRPGFLQVVTALLLMAAGVAVTWEAWREIYDIAAHDEEYSHIFLVPLLAVWLLWVRRLRMTQIRISGTMIGPVFIGAGWALSYLGFNYGGQAVFHLGALLVVLGCVFSVLGKQALFRFLPAVLVLLFIVPVPAGLRQEIALPLQNWTARIAQFLLDLARIDTVVSGNTLAINGERVQVAEACNGMRMVFPMLLISYAFAFALPLRPGVRITLVLISPVVALACNVLRTLPTIWLYGKAGNLSGDEHTQAWQLADRFHNISGWVMLPLSFLMLLGLIRLLRWMMVPVERYTLAGHA